MAKVRTRIRSSKGDKVFDAVNFTLLTMFGLIILVPCLFVLNASLSSPSAVMAGKVTLLPVGFNADSYRAVFANPLVFSGYFNSIVYTAATVLLNLLLSVLAGYPLSREDYPFRRQMMFAFAFTMYFSGGLIPQYILISRILKLDNSPLALVLPGAMSVFNLILVRNYLEHDIPNEILEASQIDGCNDFGYLWRIAVPLAKPVLAVITLYSAVAMWNSYYNAMLYITKPSLYPLSLVLRNILIQNQFNSESLLMFRNPEVAKRMQDLQDMMKYALIIVGSVPVMLLYPLIQRYFVKGVTLGAVKG
jgi:multiple sugar transport system permease protein/putative aldouronate transport system permease protein